MTKRASFTEAELLRALKGARKAGAVVAVRDGTIYFLPPDEDRPTLPPVQEEEPNTCAGKFGRAR